MRASTSCGQLPGHSTLAAELLPSLWGRFTLNSVGMLRRLASLDMGISLLPEEIVADELAAGSLCRIMPAWHGTPQAVYAIAETRQLPAKTQRFIEFMQQRLGQGHNPDHA